MKRRASIVLRALRVAAVRLRFIVLVAMAGLLGALAEDLWALARSVLAPARLSRAAGGWLYICPMHPAVVRSEPGKCPSCGMPLGRRAATDHRAAARATERPRLEGIAFAQVERRPLVREVIAPAALEIDERRVVRLSTPVRAAVQQVFVAAPGAIVHRGEILAALASRELFAFARELQRPVSSEDATAVLARERLLQMGLSEVQLNRIRAGRDPTRFDLISPVDGILVAKAALPGDQVAELTPLLTVADVRRLWLTIRLSEEEGLLVRPGTPIDAELLAAPGLTLRTTVQWIDASVDSETRTLAARAEVPNPEGALRPGMTARARLRVAIGSEVEPPLVVPASAVVDTGDRQVVWRQGEKECSPQAVEVEVAARAGAYWAIAKGLAEGDRVVVHGAFLLSADERLASGAPAMGAAARSGAREND